MGNCFHAETSFVSVLMSVLNMKWAASLSSYSKSNFRHPDSHNSCCKPFCTLQRHALKKCSTGFTKTTFWSNVAKVRSGGLRHVLLEFLQQEKTKVRMEFTVLEYIFLLFWLIVTTCQASVPACSNPVKEEGSWQMLLPTIRGLWHHHCDFLYHWYSNGFSKIVDWFWFYKSFFSARMQKTNIFPIMLNYFFRDFLKNYFSFSLFFSWLMYVVVLLDPDDLMILNAPFRWLCLLSRRERSGVAVGGHPRVRHHQAEDQRVVSPPASLQTPDSRQKVLTGMSWHRCT